MCSCFWSCSEPSQQLGAFELALLSSVQSSANQTKVTSRRRSRQTETETDHLIRLGQMTPFGTSVMLESATPSSQNVRGSLDGSLSMSQEQCTNNQGVTPPLVAEHMTVGHVTAAVGSLSKLSEWEREQPVAILESSSSSRSRSITPAPVLSDFSEDEYNPSAGDMRDSFLSSGSSEEEFIKEEDQKGRGKEKRKRLLTNDPSTKRQKLTSLLRSRSAKKRASCYKGNVVVEENRVRAKGARRLKFGKECVDDGDDSVFRRRMR